MVWWLTDKNRLNYEQSMWGTARTEREPAAPCHRYHWFSDTPLFYVLQEKNPPPPIKTMPASMDGPGEHYAK